MLKLIYLSSRIIIISALFVAALPALAQIAPVQGTGLGIPEAGSLVDYLVKIVNVGLALIGVIAAVYIIISGIRYILSGGDEGDAKKAKNGILFAVIGLVVVGLAAMIVNFVINAFR